MTEFEKIYKTYFNDVYLYIRRLSGSEEIAEEITSETFFKALKAIDSFRGECEIRVWLLRIAKNSFYSYIKKNKNLSPLDETLFLNLPDTAQSLEEQVDKKLDALEIQSILNNLEEPFREVFMWRVFANLSFKEIAGIFNKNENWACVTYHRARKKILERLGEKNEK